MIKTSEFSKKEKDIKTKETGKDIKWKVLLVL
jgi:hypothetical protein